MKYWVSLISICLVLALAGGSVLAADKEVVVKRVGDDVTALNPGGQDRGDCLMGNLNPAYYSIGDWIWGAESYKYMFYADPADCACQAGFTVQAVHMYMQFGVEDVPVTFEAYVDFEEADWDNALGCWVPGPEICISPVYSITVDTAGLYDIALPMEQCPCAYFGYWYGISFNFVTAFAEYPDAISDNIPVGCTSWTDYGAGWLDLMDFGWPGEIIMYADILCCDPPVDTEQKSFDQIKALFR